MTKWGILADQPRAAANDANLWLTTTTDNLLGTVPAIDRNEVIGHMRDSAAELVQLLVSATILNNPNAVKPTV